MIAKPNYKAVSLENGNYNSKFTGEEIDTRLEQVYKNADDINEINAFVNDNIAELREVVSDETKRATQAEKGLDTRMTAEEAKVKQLDSRVSSEVSRAMQEERELAARISSEENKLQPLSLGGTGAKSGKAACSNLGAVSFFAPNDVKDTSIKNWDDWYQTGSWYCLAGTKISGAPVSGEYYRIFVLQLTGTKQVAQLVITQNNTYIRTGDSSTKTWTGWKGTDLDYTIATNEEIDELWQN